MLTGVNRQIVDRVGDHPLLKTCQDSEIEQALSAIDPNMRREKAVEVITKVWRDIPGLGIPPLLQHLKWIEDTNGLYDGYREHVVHSLQVFLLGLDILQNLPVLRRKLLNTRRFDNLDRAWAVASLGHDHGYFLSATENGTNPMVLQNLLENPLDGVGYDTGLLQAFKAIPCKFSPGETKFISSLTKLRDADGNQIDLIDSLEDKFPPNILGRAPKPIRQYMKFFREVLYHGSEDHGISSALILLQLFHRLYFYLDSVDWKHCKGENQIFLEWDGRRTLEQAKKDFYAGCIAITLHNITNTISQNQQERATAEYQLDLQNYRLTINETPLAWLLTFCDILQGWNRPQPTAAIGGEIRYAVDPEDRRIDYDSGFMYITFKDKDESLEKSSIDPFWALRNELTATLNAEDFTFLLEGPLVPQKKSKNTKQQDTIQLNNYSNMGVISDRSFSKKDFEFRYKASKRNLHYTEDPVCVLYTGGSVGMVPKDTSDDDSPLVTAPLDRMLPYLNSLYRLKFNVHFFELPEVLDSSNIGLQDWQEIGHIIKNLYNYYQGFVVLHGTDTMTYTASALSFMFDKLNKPIIFTGAERPLCLPQSDAESNIMRSLQIAAPTSIEMRIVPEVCIFFGTRLLRANRTKKTHALDFNGFDSPNYHHLGRVEDKVEIFEHYVRKNCSRNTDIEYKPDLEAGIAIFEIYPNLKADGPKQSTEIDFFRYLLLSEESRIKGLILKTYGTGNAPSMPYDFLKIIEEAIRTKGIVIVNLTHCLTGEVEVRLFETNVRLFELGVINGGDMTVEAAYTKLMHLIKEYPNPIQDKNGFVIDGVDVETIRSEFQINKRGELRYSARSIVYPKTLNGQVEVKAGVFSGENQKIDLPEDANITKAYIRVTELKPINLRENEKITLSFFINALQYINELTSERAQVFKVKSITREFTGEPITFNVDATQIAKMLLPGKNVGSLQIFCEDKICATIGTYELAILTEDNH